MTGIALDPDDLADKRRRLLAAMLREAGHATGAPDRIGRADRAGSLPLSPAQQRLWTLDRLIPHSPLYNAPLAYRLRGRLDRDALAEAFSRLVARHEVLRTTFTARNGTPEQVIAPVGNIRIDVVSSRGGRDLIRLIREAAETPVDLERGPLLRVRLVELAGDDHVLLITLHHILTDTWSLGVMFRELAVWYDHARGLPVAALPEPEIQYADFAAWQRKSLTGERLKRQLSYWSDLLRDAPRMLTLPADHPPPVTPTFAGATHTFTVPATVAAQLRTLAANQDATLFMVLLAAFAGMLVRYTGETDIVVCSPVAGRGEVALEPLIGFFVNNLVLRLDLGGDADFADILQRVRRAALDAYDHQDLPFELLVEELHPERHLGRQPLAQISFQVAEPPAGGDAAAPEELVLPGVSVEALTTSTNTSKFDMSVSITSRADGLRCAIEYSSELYDAGTIDRFATNFRTMLHGIAQAPGCRLSALPVVAQPELRLMLDDWNRTDQVIDEGPCLHDIVESVARRTPDAVAVVADTVELTYRELDQRANALAHRLRASGVGADVVVGVYADRSPETVVAMLAVLKAGGAFLPLDRDQPPQRLESLLTDAGARVVLVQRELIGTLPDGLAIAVMVLGGPDTALATAVTSPTPAATPDTLAYVIFTSGSTGRPKCVVTPHRGIVNMLVWARREYAMTPADRMVHKAPFSFDVSVWEVFWPLVFGGSVVLARPGGQRDARYLARLVQQHAVTTIHFVPTMLRAFMAVPSVRECDRLRQVICGGEPLTTDLVADFYTAFPAEDVVLHNQYGPAEVSVQTTTWPLLPGCRRVVLGRGVWNTRLYVLDPSGQPVPLGVIGELHLAGVQLARGYKGQPGLTAERFVPDPFGPPGTRMYRSGDLVRWLPDGTLEFLGRSDQQVKIGGFRIEPGEVQSQLVDHPDVRQAIVVAQPGPSGGKQLVAYVVAAAGQDADQLPTLLRTFLADRLPSYLVPTWFVTLDALPLNHNGKVDVKALPVPRVDDRPAFVAPRTSAEGVLSRVWAEVLRLDSVGISENFFALGGDSIRAIEVVSRAEAAGLELTPNQIFLYQTVGELAAVARESAPADAVFPDSEPQAAGPAALTPVQLAFFRTGPLTRDNLAQYTCLAVPEDLAPDKLDQALDHLVARHEALRTRYLRPDGQWRQEVDPYRPGRRLELLQVEAGLDNAIGACVRDAVDRLEPGSGRVFLPILLTPGDHAPVLVLVAHHLSVDAVSWRILGEELDAAYRQLAAGDPVRLPARTTPLRVWSQSLAQRAQGPEFAAEAAFWRGLLRQAAPAPPVDRVPVEPLTYMESEQVVATLPTELMAALAEVQRGYRVQLHEILIAATALALSHWAGSSTVRLDLEGHGREQIVPGVDLTRTVGWFTSVFPLVVRLKGDSDVESALIEVKEALRTMPHRGLGFGLLSHLRQGEHRIEDEAAGGYLFNFLGRIDVGDASTLFPPVGEPLRLAATATRPRGHLIESDAFLQDGQAVVRWGFSPLAHDQATIVALADGFTGYVREIAERCGRPDSGALTISDVPLSGLSTADLARHFGTGRDIHDIYPLSPIQEGLLFHTLMASDAAMYMTQASWRLGDVDAAVLAEAWQEIMRRYPVLRTRFSWTDVPQPLQIVERTTALPVSYHDWSSLTADEQTAALDGLLDAGRRDPIALDRAPLLRIGLIREGTADWRILLECHHILLDGWSVVALLADVQAVYRSLKSGAELHLPARQPFRDYIAWELGRPVDADRAYWTEHLAGITAPTHLPIGAPTGATGQGALDVSLHDDLAVRIDAFTRHARITLGTLFQAAWALVLGRYGDAGDVVFGVTVSGRSGMPGLQDMVGLLINTLPQRVRIRRDASPDEWMHELQADRARVPSEHASLAEIKGWSEMPARAPLFESIVVIENYPIDDEVRMQLGGLSASVLRLEEMISYPVRLVVSPGPPFEVQLRHDLSRVRPQRLRLIGENLTIALTALVESPVTTVGELLERLHPYPAEEF